MFRIDKNLKQSLFSGELTIGSWITIGDTSVAEIMARSGFDWLTVDMEHSAITLAQTQELIRIIELSGVVPLVRVGENNSNLIKRVMDAGAYGIIVPMINTKEEAQSAVSAAKYPLEGTRGVGLARAQGYGLDFERYRDCVNKDSVVIVQIEHIKAIGNLEEILNTSGVDGSIIGPYDLSASLGCPGQFQKKEVKDAIRKYLRVCNELGKPAGIHVVPPDIEEFNSKLKEGFKFAAFSFDALFLGTKIKEELSNLEKSK